MSPFVVIWNDKPESGYNMTLFDTKEEALEFGEYLIALDKSYSVTVCSVIRYYLHERKEKK